jgi:hypothetical protein
VWRGERITRNERVFFLSSLFNSFTLLYLICIVFAPFANLVEDTATTHLCFLLYCDIVEYILPIKYTHPSLERLFTDFSVQKFFFIKTSDSSDLLIQHNRWRVKRRRQQVISPLFIQSIFVLFNTTAAINSPPLS